MQRILAAAAVSLALASPALAQRSYPTCAQAQASLARSGAAVIYTAPHIYDRYVVGRAFCAHGEYARRAVVETRDSAACFLGYTCVVGSPRDDW